MLIYFKGNSIGDLEPVNTNLNKNFHPTCCIGDNGFESKYNDFTLSPFVQDDSLAVIPGTSLSS